MTKLFNINPHSPPGQEIDAATLLHFTADAVQDWECDAKDCENGCPWRWSICRMPENVPIAMCILEGIKDVAFIYLSPKNDDTEEDNV